DVDQPGRHHLAARVDHPVRWASRARLDGRDAAIKYGHVGLSARSTATVDYVAAADSQVVHDPLRSSPFPSSPCCASHFPTTSHHRIRRFLMRSALHSQFPLFVFRRSLLVRRWLRREPTTLTAPIEDGQLGFVSTKPLV